MLLLILGILIIILTFIDFFHTTLSSNGFGRMSKFLNQKLTEVYVRNLSGKWMDFSGITHLLVTFFVWIFLLFLGTFLIFISSEQMVVVSGTGAPASVIERLYFTGFVLTTLGVGDMIPGTDVSRIFTTLSAFSGFVMLTTGMSYLISILSGVKSRKNLATSISGMGKDLLELYEYCKIRDGSSNLIVNSATLKQMIINYTSQHKSLPIIHYFFTSEKAFAVVVQLSRLYEVMNVIHNKFDEDSLERQEIESVQSALDYLLRISLFRPEKYTLDQEELIAYREAWEKYDTGASKEEKSDEQVDAYLKSSGWSWRDVYER